MKKTFVALLAVLSIAATAAAEVRGTYLETRNAEIYASHCFANAEAGILGDLAVMAWKVDSGAVDGISLDGLGVVAVVKASQTIGDPFKNPLPAQTMLIVDERATPAQRVALETLAKRSGGELLNDVILVEAAPIALAYEGSMHDKVAKLTAGDMISVETRAIVDSDSLCHLDNIYYQPIAELDHAMAAHALKHSIDVESLGVDLTEYRRSSVYLGSYVLADSEMSDD